MFNTGWLAQIVSRCQEFFNFPDISEILFPHYGKFNNRFIITENLLRNTIRFKFQTVDQHWTCFMHMISFIHRYCLIVNPPRLFIPYNDVHVDLRLCSVLRGVYSDTTQLNSTELNWLSWAAYSQVSHVFVYDVTTYKLSQLLFTLSSWVQLSWVVLL